MSRWVISSSAKAVSTNARRGLLDVWAIQTNVSILFNRRGCALKRVKWHLDYQRIVRAQLAAKRQKISGYPHRRFAAVK